MSEPNTIIPSHGKRRFDVWFSHLFVFVFFQKLEADFEQDFRCQPLHIPIHSIAFFLFGHFHSNSYHQKKSPPPPNKLLSNSYILPKKATPPPFVDLSIGLVMQFHKTFKRLKQYDSITLRVGPHEVSTLSMTRLVKNHRHLGLKLQQREIIGNH